MHLMLLVLLFLVELRSLQISHAHSLGHQRTMMNKEEVSFPSILSLFSPMGGFGA